MPGPGDCLLDTSVVVDHLRNAPGAAARLQAIPSLYLSTIALGELYLGALRSARPSHNRSQVDQFADLCIVLACDEATAQSYAAVKLALQQQGTPIPENDVWIAAIAMQHGLTLSTRDSHFTSVAGLALDLW
jgi:tRNA(fMet)-specific endonuclease VapC